MSNNLKLSVMEKRIIPIKVSVDGIVGKNKERYCDYFLPFYGTQEQAKAAAVGLGQGCAEKAKQFYGSGWVVAMADTEILMDNAI
jgi:hypothetical protein